MLLAASMMLWSAVAAAQGAPSRTPADSLADEYTVTFVPGERPRASVEALLTLPDGAVRAGQGAIDHLPGAWGTFVQKVQLVAADGRVTDAAPMEVREGVARWRFPGVAGQRVRVRYEVDFAFALEKWPPGNEQGALWTGDALFTVTKPLLLAAETGRERRVRFVLPPGWRASTPWPRTGDGRYTVTSLESLINNTVVLGRHVAVDFQEGPFTLRLALPGASAGSAREVQALLGSMARQYVALFPNTPPMHYLMTLLCGEQADGEGFRQSGAFTTTCPLPRRKAVVWGNTLAHELFHLWNGAMIRPGDREATAWFREGFTEYYANRALRRGGFIDAAALRGLAEMNLGLYTYFRAAPAFDTVSVRDAGTRTTRYRFGNYNGGWAVAFVLDQEIQLATDGRRNLDTMMRGLFDSHGGRAPVAFDDIVRAASAAAGRDMSGFFAKYVTGREVLPLRSALAWIGLEMEAQDYAAEMHLFDDPAASPAARERRARFFAAGR